MSDIKEKNKAARAAITAQTGAPMRGDSGKVPDTLEGTPYVVLYPSTVLPSDYDYSISGQHIVNENDLDAKDGNSLKRNLDLAASQKPYSEGMFPLYSQYLNQTLISSAPGEGLTISTVGIKRGSTKSKPSKKSKVITDTANKILSELIIINNKEKDIAEERVQDLKEKKMITDSEIFKKYSDTISKLSDYGREKRDFYGTSSPRRPPGSTVKEEYFQNKKALIKYRTSTKGSKTGDAYSYVTNTGTEMRNQPVKTKRSNLKSIRILKFEQVDINDKENIKIANDTIFVDVE